MDSFSQMSDMSQKLELLLQDLGLTGDSCFLKSFQNLQMKQLKIQIMLIQFLELAVSWSFC